MPLYDFLCLDCGKVSEMLLTNSGDAPECLGCGSNNLKRMLSATSSLSGASRNSSGTWGYGLLWFHFRPGRWLRRTGELLRTPALNARCGYRRMC
jgi:putative FmdB family regulatory protein